MGRERSRAWKHLLLCAAGLILLSLFNCAVINDYRQKKEAQDYLLSGRKLLAQRSYEDAVEAYQQVLSLSPRKPPEDEALFDMALVYAHFGNPRKDYRKSMELFLRVLNDYPKSPLADQARIWIGVLMESTDSMRRVERLKETIKDLQKANRAAKESAKPKQPDAKEAKIEEYGEGREHLLRGQKLLAQGNYEGAISENKKILSLTDPRSPKDEATFNLGLIYAHFGNPLQDLDKSAEFFKTVIKNNPKGPLAEQAKVWVDILQEYKGLSHLVQKLKQVDIEIEEMKRKKTEERE